MAEVGRVWLGCGMAASMLCLAALARLGQPASALAAPPGLAEPVERSADGTTYDAIDMYLERELPRLKVPGAALAVVDGDRIVHTHGFGQADARGDAPLPQTPFFIGSITKSFTALAVMQLVEAGAVDLDAPVQRYLPWFRVAAAQASARMTVRHLLNQTSGLPMSTGWTPLADFDSRPDASERQARALATQRLNRPVGAAFEYSNMNYNLLGLIVEAVSGQRYADYVRTRILQPLDMGHSYTDPAEAQRSRLALGHRYWFGQPIADEDDQFPLGSLASGQLVSTSEDLSHWLIAHLNGGRYGGAQVLSPAGIDEMHRPAVDFSLMGQSGQYGMGWFVSTQGGRQVVWHDGVVPAYFGYMALLPGQQRGLVLLFNADHFLMSNTALVEVGMGAAALLAGGQPDPVRWGGIMPWALRSLLLVPLLQVLGVVLTLRRLRRWRRAPELRPSRGRTWALHVLLPLMPNALLVAAPLGLASSSLRGFLLYGPDFTWTALVCGGFAGLWMFVRSWLVLGHCKEDRQQRSVDMRRPRAA